MAIKKLSTEKIKSLGGNIFKFSIAPEKHFRTIYISFLLLLAGSIFYHASFFTRLNSHTLFSSSGDNTENSGKTINKAKLESVLSRFEKRKENEPAIQELMPPVSEPGR